MAVLTLSFYDPSDGSLIGTLDHTQVKSFEMRAALYQLGAGSFSLSRHLAAASLDLLAKDVIVIPTFESVNGGQPFWGMIIRDDVAALLSQSEQGGEDLTITGPSLYALLANATLDEETWAPVPPASEERGSSQVAGDWFWIAQPYGAIYTRAIEEGINEPGTPLGLVTITFDRSEDSDGVPWFEMAFDYRVPTGTNVLELGDRLSMTGQFFPIMVPIVTDGVLSIELSAYQEYEFDLTNDVRFAKGLNILTELRREQRASRVTHVLVKDKDGTFHPVFTDGVSYDQARWQVLELLETNDPDTIEQVANTLLEFSRKGAEEFTFEHGVDIRPIDNYGLGALVTVHTGDGLHDLEESIQQVTGYRITLDKASKDGEERSLHYVVETGYRDPSGMSGTNPTGGVSDGKGEFFRHRAPHEIEFIRDYEDIYAQGSDLTSMAYVHVKRSADTDSEVVLWQSNTDGGESPTDLYSMISLDQGVMVLLARTRIEIAVDEGDLVAYADQDVSLEAGTGGVTGKHLLHGGFGVVLPEQAADPGSGLSQQGQLYYNTSTDTIRWYNGTAWADISASDVFDVVGGDYRLPSGFTTIESTTGDSYIYMDAGYVEIGGDGGYLYYNPGEGWVFGGPEGVVLPNLAADPGPSQAGQLYWSTSADKLRVYDGTSWVDVGTGGGSAAHYRIITAYNGTHWLPLVDGDGNAIDALVP